jgi:peptide deformylase
MKLLQVRKHFKNKDPLRMKARAVEDINDKTLKIISDMETWCKANEKEIMGIAAPQLGHGLRIIIIWQKALRRAMINPEIISTDGRHQVVESCLSLRKNGKMRIFKVYRPKRVKLAYTDINGQRRTIKGAGVDAQLFMHEVNHLDGILLDEIAFKELT